MKKFLTNDFLLNTEYAKILYHNYAKDMPIFDWHCHLEAEEIYKNEKINSITKAWLGGDHYKWRVMRAVGIDEDLITGNASDLDKFKSYAATMPNLIGNPIYHWTHLELKKYFDIDYCLEPDTAEEIFNITNEKLTQDDFRPRELIKMSNVAAVCTTNDPIDDLHYHDLLAEDESFQTKVKPAFRPDKAISIEKDSYISYIKELSEVAGVEINSFDTLKEALEKRMNFFKEKGCEASDQAFKYIPFEKISDKEVNEIIKKKLNGEKLEIREEDAYKTALMIWLGSKYNELNWAMELHIGVIRDNSTKLYNKLGNDVGADATNDEPWAENLANLLNIIEQKGAIPRTIIFPLNPAEFYPASTIAGSFNRGNDENVLTAQIGPSWWHIDHKEGMLDQMKIMSATSAFAKSIGMITDSRSFLSYPRHEYFRRLLCRFIGEIIADGEYPWDEEFLGNMVKDICFNNAKNIIKIDL